METINPKATKLEFEESDSSQEHFLVETSAATQSLDLSAF